MTAGTLPFKSGKGMMIIQTNLPCMALQATVYMHVVTNPVT